MAEETSPTATTGTAVGAEGPKPPIRGPSSGFRGPGGPRPGGPGPFRRGRFSGGRDARPRKACRFCVERKDTLDYKDIVFLRSFTTERGKILSGRTTGTCAWHQRKVRTAVKRARLIALMPFAV
ncbi:MAG: 30S ribosomal protein S18 [Elusimicrobia bacterium]|nr:30S ribosomal protein S18 [Elusimicrobiota bacterium]